MCGSNEIQPVSATSQFECFIQILLTSNSFATKKYPHIGNVLLFRNNSAKKLSGKLYGGLLDRCTITDRAQHGILYSEIQNSFDPILNETTSDPVRVCPCNPKSNTVNCSYNIPKLQRYRKGSNLTVRVAALDHVKRLVPATIQGLLLSKKGHLGHYQQAQKINATCTDLNVSIFSPLQDQKSDQLMLYAEGPCNNLGISSLKINFTFLCWCPIGFEPVKEIEDRCVCSCHHTLRKIFPLIKDTDCNPETLLITRQQNFWITAVNLTNITFVSYQHCPATYCHPSTTPVYIDFNTPNGPDVQCALNHTGVLCGKCPPNLTLSIGSSSCTECPRLWPIITVAGSVGYFIVGLFLVALILVLNLTVASGTLNAMIFYANVLAINHQQFMPFKVPNFHSVVISLLNLESEFGICFFDGLDAYTKAWLQLISPVYIILIVIVMIITSHYSKKFSYLIAHKNPVATLATLILLSYAKLLQTIIGILSPANLRYTPTDVNSSAFTKIVWLYDGSIPYLRGKHIPLFLVVVFIVVVGFAYTFLLLSWQWLVKFSHKKIFFWVRNTKLSSFMDAYHAPYTARNRYWTGLLLLARVILYLTASMNISGEPSLNLLIISWVILCILVVHLLSGIRIYKKWMLNVFEFATIFNILAFVVSKLYIQQVGGSHTVVAYLSISVQIFIFILSLLHHFVVQFDLLPKIKNCKCFKNRFNHQNLHVSLLDDQYTPPSRGQTVTTTEVSINSPKQLLKTKSEHDCDSERKELTALLEIEASL